MNPTRRYVYGPSWSGLVVFALCFGGISAFTGWHAIHVGRATKVTFYDLIPLNATGATVYYWTVAGFHWIAATLSGLLALPGLLLAVCRARNPRILELAGDAILLPHRYFQARIARIPYAEIKRVREKVLGRMSVLYIATAERTFEIPHLLLPDIGTYHAVKDLIFSCVPDAGIPSVNPEPLSGLAGEEFRKKKGVLDHHLRHLGPFPWGIVFSLLLVLPLVAVSMILYISILPFTDFLPEARVSLRNDALWILGFCVVIIGSFLFAHKIWKRRLKEMDFECPACHQCLGSSAGKVDMTADTCGSCGRQGFR